MEKNRTIYMYTKREGVYLYTLQDGEDWRLYRDMIIVVHPERRPKIVHKDGTVEEIDLG